MPIGAIWRAPEYLCRVPLLSCRMHSTHALAVECTRQRHWCLVERTRQTSSALDRRTALFWSSIDNRSVLALSVLDNRVVTTSALSCQRSTLALTQNRSSPPTSTKWRPFRFQLACQTQNRSSPPTRMKWTRMGTRQVSQGLVSRS